MVSWEGIALPSALPVAAAGEGGLVKSFGGSLVAAESGIDLRAVYIGFDIVEADFPFRIAFPVLLRNILAWFHEEERSVFDDVYATGAVISPLADLPGGPESALITYPGPDGPEESTVPIVGLRFTFSETTTQGPIRIEAGGISYLTCVSLTDPEESNIAPIREEVGEIVTEASFLLHREFWRAFAAAALALVLIEWALFYRRVTD